MIDGGVFSMNTAMTLNPNRGITLGGTNSVGTIDGIGGLTYVIPGVISGGGLIKTGASLIQLAGGNTYTGTTYLTVDRTQAQNSNAFGTTAGGVVVFNGATLELSNSLPGGSIIIGAEAVTLNP